MPYLKANRLIDKKLNEEFANWRSPGSRVAQTIQILISRKDPDVYVSGVFADPDFFKDTYHVDTIDDKNQVWWSLYHFKGRTLKLLKQERAASGWIKNRDEWASTMSMELGRD